MQVIKDTTILGQIKTAISENVDIKYIQVTAAEMQAFLNSQEFKTHPSADKHYASDSLPVPTKIAGVKKEGDVPSSCMYQGIRIVVVEEPVVAEEEEE